ncbi:unnamed protein product [Toxocara canis]|nr:unnamed protein product [Toxocara canis]
MELMRCDSTIVQLKEVKANECSAEAESKLALMKRRSAIFEKALLLENVDSFYDEDLDEQLLALDERENCDAQVPK